MAIPIHVVYVRLVQVDQAGNIVDKNNADSTLADYFGTGLEHRVQAYRPGVEPVVANSTDQPTVPVFLAREAAAGYRLQYQDQRMMVLYHAG